jgi:crotonobetainyl-CoA:carnitine CoA-transferase CaiB-like acyl-CoA transferase
MMASNAGGGLLEGISVVECGQGIAASFAARQMADLGADVIKVEVGHGDITRSRGPFPGDRFDPEKSGLFIYLNASKRSVKIDLLHPEGRALLMGLLRGADVLIHNVHPSDREATGLISERIAALCPRLIVTTVSPFGDTGPYSGWRAASLNLVHGGGWAFLTPLGSTQPELPPLKVFGQQADFLAGCFAFYTTLAAYRHRTRSGKGQTTDISQQECVASILEVHFMRYTYAGREISRLDEYRTGVSGILDCVDGQVYVLAHEEGQWLRLLEVLGHPQWSTDERFKDNPSRSRNHGAAVALLQESARHRSVDDFFAACRQHNVICTPVNTMRRANADPQLRERGCFVPLDQPGVGALPLPVPPSRFSAGGSKPRGPAPRLGQHTEEVLRERLGMTLDEIDAMRARGVV